jgi:outer membrane protein
LARNPLQWILDTKRPIAGFGSSCLLLSGGDEGSNLHRRKDGAESKRAKLSTAQSDETITDRRNAITQQVRTALSSLQAARNELQLSTEALRLSTREVIESRDRFQAGVTNNIEVITAQNSLAQATDSQIGAMYRLQKAKADLSQARGRIAEEYGD